MAAGVPGGAATANHEAERNAGNSSAMVGTSGKARERASSAIARILALPARCNGSEVTMVSNIMSTWPAMMSFSAGPARDRARAPL